MSDFWLFQCIAFAEGISDYGSECYVLGSVDVECQRFEFGGIDLAVGEDRFIHAGTDDVAEVMAMLCVVGVELAFHADGVVGEDGGVHALGFFGVKAALAEFVGVLVTRNNSHVIGGDHVLLVGNLDGEGPALEDVLCGHMVSAQAEEDLMVVAYGSPGGVHGIRCAVVVVGSDYQNRLRID